MSTIAAMVLFLLLCSLVTGWVVINSGKRESVFDTLLLLLTSLAGELFLIPLVLGIIGLLQTAAIVVFHLLLVSAALLYAYYNVFKRNCKTMLRRWRRSWQRIAGRSARFFKSGSVRVLLLFFVLILAIPAFYNIALPVHDWDGFMYHLFLPAMWLQQGSLAVFSAAPQLQLDKWVHFSATTELATAWWMAVSGSDRGAVFPLWLFVLSGLLSLCGLLRLFGAGNRTAVWVLPLSVSVPVALSQLNSSYADFSIAALFFLTVYLGVSSFRNRSRLCTAGAALSGAILLGSKASGPLFFVLAWFAVLAVALILKRGSWKMFLRAVLLKSIFFVLAGGLLGGWFFFRNWAVRGNPLYPYRVAVAGKVLFPGIDPVKQTSSGEQKDRAAFLTRTGMDRYRQFRYNYYAHPYAGHGPLPAAAGIPGFFFLLLYFSLRGFWRRLGMLLALGMTVLFAVLAMPTLFPRFILIADLFLILCAVRAMAASRFFRPVLQLLLVAGAVYGAVVSLPMNFHTKRNIRRSLASRRRLSAADSPYSGRHFRALDRILADNRVTVAYSGLLDPYPLFGSTFRRRVLYLPQKKYLSWYKAVEKEGVFLLVLGKPGFAYKEQAWVRRGRFIRVRSNSKVDLWLHRNGDNLKKWRRMVKNADFK